MREEKRDNSRSRGGLAAAAAVLGLAAVLAAAGLVFWQETRSCGREYVVLAAETAGTEGRSKEIEQSETAKAGPGAENPSGPEESSAETEPVQEEPVTLLFAGDVYLSDHVLGAYQKAGGIHGVLDEGIREEIRQADLFMVNQEFPFTDRGTAAADKQYTFRLPPSSVSMFQEMGIDMVTLANNHILDFGAEGLLDSCSVLDGAGIRYVGGGPDLERARQLEIVEIKGKKIGFLGTSRVYMDVSLAAGPEHPGVFSTYDPAQALEAIRAADSQCDYLVVYVHWGIERNTEPEEYQRTMGRQYIDAGADLVVGSHPHVLQEIETYQGKTIAYSLGNFVFGSSIPQTELLKVVLDETGAEISTIACTSSGGYTRLAE